ncbi:UNVERIFIED_ORG: virus tail fiber assembly protein lambda gpK [Citrobacter freundii]
MMHLKNIKKGQPRTRKQYELLKRENIVLLFSEDGKDWYEEQKNFSPDTLKIAYDQNGIIRRIETDVTTINPEGFSVVELLATTANRRADIYGGWMFHDGKIIKRIYTAEELQRQAESKKSALLFEAESIILPLERAARWDMATTEERRKLEAWERYSVLLSRVNLEKPEWPEKPSI